MPSGVGVDGSPRGFGGNNAGARGHKQYLITPMRVHFITHPRWEVHDPSMKELAYLRRQNRLPAHLAREQRTRGRFGGNSTGFHDLHIDPPVGHSSRCTPLGTGTAVRDAYAT